MDKLNRYNVVKYKYVKKLLNLQNVTAVGIGYKTVDNKKTKEIAIIVSVTKKVPFYELERSQIIPEKLDGVRTDVVESGEIVALKLRTDKWRPAPGGVSIGHYKITAGTLGGLVTKDNEIFILSNNHILANSNDAAVGDAIYQPGPYDGGSQSDTIASLHQFVPIDFGGGGGGGSPCPFAKFYTSIGNGISKFFGSNSRLRSYQIMAGFNLVDCAVAKPLAPVWGMVDPNILDIGIPVGVIEAALNMEVQKSGRTTGLKYGIITQVNATVTVGYGGGKTAIFDNQIITTELSQGGDSGSWLLNDSKNVVGLLFAGSDTMTIHNPIQLVLNELRGYEIYVEE